MNRYLKLVNFELGRFTKLYVVLLAITLITQIAGVIITANRYLNQASQSLYEEMISKADFLAQQGPISFTYVVRSIWFLGPIALCIAAVAFFIFFIWYRDWFGKNTFIYRLLMLPTARLNIFMAKITAILLMVLGFIAFQLIILPIEATVLKWMVPKEFRLDMGMSDIVNSLPELQMLIPQTLTEFLLYYGAGFMVVSILFTAILFERSYRLKGILLGAGFSALAVAIFISPILVQDLLLGGLFFYPLELIGLEIVMGLIVTFGSIWMSRFLLNKKVTV